MIISIIIPVYNTAQYLRHCLQSVVDQKLADYEVILVNDASTDNSLGICIEWCESYPEFRIISHTHNRGLSEARNTGLQHASGQFVSFLDSDDFLAPGTLSAALDEIGDADVLEFPIRVYHYARDAYDWFPAGTSCTFDEWMLAGGWEHSYAPNKLYRRSLWNNFSFPAGVNFEDLRTVPYVLQSAHSIVCSQHGLYYYCWRNGSITHTPTLRNLQQYAQALHLLLQMPVNQHNHILYLRALNAQVSYRRLGGTDRIVQHRHLPWHLLFSTHLDMRQRIKLILNNLCLI